MRVSVIVPVLNEAANIVRTLERFQSMRRQGHEVLLVDGGSIDHTVRVAAPLVDGVLQAPSGRARQMNAGAAVARGDILWFVHADTLVAEDAVAAVVRGMAHSRRRWGRFDVRLSGQAALLRVVETAMNLRSRITGIATGDQGIFVARALFGDLGGYADIPLMEDVALSRALLRAGHRPLALRQRIVTSSRRWEREGIVSTIVLMWSLRLAYSLGVSPERLVRRYRAA
jgi:rSAM/selenodomain-associated transferase 2